MKNTITKMINKILRWARFHKPEHGFRNSYDTSSDKYWLWLAHENVNGRVFLTGPQRDWELSKRYG